MATFSAQISSRDGRPFGAYVARPDAPNGHAIVLLQEIFGVTATIRRVADSYARDGYLVYAPDLFWRLQPGVELGHSKEEIQRAMALLREFDDDAGMADIEQAVAYIRAQPGFSGGVAAAGLCLGGKLAYLACARGIVDAAVSYYGVGIEAHLDEAQQLQCPIILHFGTHDSYVPATAQEAIAAALADHPKANVHFYDQAGHGFYTRGDPKHIQSAHDATEAFLRTHLNGKQP